MKTPITYYGGKQQMASTILAMIPSHKIYCEPFFGGGAVFFAKGASFLEVINDKNDLLVGIQDADGRDIYEGDILQSLPEEEYVAKMTNGRFHSNREAWDADPNSLSEEEKIAVDAIFETSWDYNTKAVVIYTGFTYDLVETGNPLLARHFFLCRPEFWRIVGNIHDNPELLTSK